MTEYYIGAFEIYREYGGDGSTVTLERETLHVMDDKQPIALVETRTQGNDDSPAQLVRYQFSNHLGSASLELDNAGQIISYEEYYPYGSTSYQAVRSQTEAPKRYRYTGKERDEETGLAYHGARYYAMWLGRWVSADPAFLRDGLNLYQFTRSNPVILVDFNGTDSSRATQSDRTLLHNIEDVIEERHEEGFAKYDALGYEKAKLENTIVNDFVALGETAFGDCSNKLDRLELFDIGAQIFAKRYHLEREFLAAAQRGEAESQRIADRQPIMWSEGSISTRVERAAASERMRIQRMLQTLANIEGGLGGTIGFALGGDEGSDIGNTVDTMLMAAHDTLEARAAETGNPTTAVKEPETNASAPAGIAKIHYRPHRDGSTHFTVEVRAPGKEPLETHLLFAKNGDETYVHEVGSSLKKQPPKSSVELELPNPDVAMQEQRRLIEWGNLGKFATTGKNANSCTTHVCYIVSVGGGLAPKNPADARAYIYNLFGLKP